MHDRLTMTQIGARSFPPIPARSSSRIIGRNSPCPCGSRAKFKSCCLSRGPALGAALAMPMTADERAALKAGDSELALILVQGVKCEVRGEDADRLGELLGLFVERRGGEAVARFTVEALDVYLNKITKAGMRAAIVRRVPGDAPAGISA